MRGKVTANQTQAGQQIALSPALRAMCSSLDQTTDGQERKNYHTSPAADTDLNLPYFCLNNKSCWKISLELQAVYLLSVFKKKSSLQFKLLLTGAAVFLFVTPSLGITDWDDWGRLQSCGCWETAVGGLWNSRGESRGQSLYAGCVSSCVIMGNVM